jgi:hypothetical protein
MKDGLLTTTRRIPDHLWAEIEPGLGEEERETVGRHSDRDRFLARYRSGLGATMTDESMKQTRLSDGAVGEPIADRLLGDNRLNDYFDRMIYATAAAEDSHILTEHKALLGLTGAIGETRPRSIFSWNGAR